MADFVKINKETFDQITDELFCTYSSLDGVSALLCRTRTELSLNEDELLGIGQLIKLISNKIKDIEETAKSSY